MKKLIYAVIIIGIQHLTLGIQHSFGQAPFHTPDNVGSGNCLDFDGSNDFVDCGSGTSLDNIFAGGGTVEAWINPRSDGQSNSGRVVAKQNGDNGWSVRVRDQAGGQVRIRFVHGGAGTTENSWETNRSILLNEWTHVAVVYDKGSINNNPTVYINGQAMAINQTGSPATAPMEDDDIRPLRIGNRGDNNRHFDGQVDEVRLWNVERSETDIKANMCKELVGSETGLVGYWNMNEGTGNTVGDLTTNNNDGTRQ